MERLRLPLQVSEATCVCGARLDTPGRHRAACPRSSLLADQSNPPPPPLLPPQSGLLQGHVVKPVQPFVATRSFESRSVSGLPLHHGAQLAVDITLRSATNAASSRAPAQRIPTELCSTVEGRRKPRSRTLPTGCCWHRDWRPMEQRGGRIRGQDSPGHGS